MYLSVTMIILILLFQGIYADIETYYLQPQLCGETMIMSKWNGEDIHMFRLQLSQDYYYPHNIDCKFILTTGIHGEHLLFYFEQFDVFNEKNCSADWLEMRDGDWSNAPFVSGIGDRLCGSFPQWTRHKYVTSQDSLYLKFTSGNTGQYNGFHLIVIRFHNGDCESSEYKCRNGRCIAQSLVCNGYSACGDDFECTDKETSTLSTGSLFAIALGVAFIVMMLCFILACRNKRVQRKELHPTNVTVTTPVTSVPSSVTTVANSVISLPSSVTAVPSTVTCNIGDTVHSKFKRQLRKKDVSDDKRELCSESTKESYPHADQKTKRRIPKVRQQVKAQQSPVTCHAFSIDSGHVDSGVAGEFDDFDSIIGNVGTIQMKPLFSYDMGSSETTNPNEVYTGTLTKEMKLYSNENTQPKAIYRVFYRHEK